MTTDGERRVCHCGSEGATRFCVLDALAMFSETSAEAAEAYLFLERVAIPGVAGLDKAAAGFEAGRIDAADVVTAAKAPGADSSLQAWLDSPGRRLTEVLSALDTAVLRARRMESP